MTPPARRRGFDWEAAGRELGETLGAYHVIVVLGMDPVTTGRVAVGMARAQAMHRRVALGDLFAESPPIQELVHTDDPHGIVDSFLYGISLSRIAYEVPGAGQLFVMQSGSEPPTYEDILPNPRWYRLSAGFREVGALLVLAVPASAPQIEKLIAAVDGVVLVGEAPPPQPPAARVIGAVRERRAESAAQIIETPRLAIPRWSRRRIAASAGVVLAIVAAGLTAWLAYRPLAGAARPAKTVPDCTARARAGHPCTAQPRANVLAISPDSSRRDPAADGVAPTPARVVLPSVTNPDDSAIASRFAVQLLAENTQAGAILKLQQDGKRLPAATFAPALIQGVRWFKVVSGAYTKRAEADSLLADLSRRKMLLGGASVVTLPFAFLIDVVPASAAPAMVATYADRGQPVYALRQSNGTVWLLVGAFESVEQSSLYVESLRASGVQPALVYRKGRVF